MKVFKILLISIPVLLILVVGGFFMLHNESKKNVESDILTTEEIALLQEGDIILRKGIGLASDLIITFMNEKKEISHGAMIVKNDNELYVIQSVSRTLSDFDGMQTQPLSEFNKSSTKGTTIVVRPKISNIQKMVEQAKIYLDRKIPFDHAFKLNNGNNFYCSEFIWQVITDVTGEDFFDYIDYGEGKLINFTSFLNPEHFELILTHQ